jgi:hypothetical protein
MPGKVKVKIVAGRNLPIMDRSSDTTDAYVEIKLGNTTFKTDVCRKSLNPQWNSEWYRFEVSLIKFNFKTSINCKLNHTSPSYPSLWVIQGCSELNFLTVGRTLYVVLNKVIEN